MSNFICAAILYKMFPFLKHQETLNITDTEIMLIYLKLEQIRLELAVRNSEAHIQPV